MGDLKDQYDKDYTAKYYKNGSIETIIKMERIWGTKRLALFCEMTAFKYRERMGKKPEQDILMEMGKILWYERKAEELINKIGTDQEIIVII